MKNFIFGEQTYEACYIKAKTLEHAIKVFKVQELFPERFVRSDCVKETDYNNDLGRYDYQFEGDPKINVYEGPYLGKAKVVYELPLSECIDISYKELLPKASALLPPVEGQEGQEEQKSEEVLPVIGTREALVKYNKRELREKKDAILVQKARMEVMVRELNESLSVLKDELRQKVRLLQAFETFLGVREEVYILQEGESTNEAPWTVYQQVLYMDEEVGVWEDGGIDFRNLDVFDEWVTKKYEIFLSQPKSVCVFRVRRNKKDHGDSFINWQAEHEDMKTYFLIRNGENLYRIWGDICVHDRLFPSHSEYQEIVDDDWGDDASKKRKLNEKHRGYAAGLLYLQGLIDRTDILGTNLKNVSLIKGDFTEDQIVLVRDAEREYWLTDGHLSWRDFIKKNRETITQGTRVVISMRGWKGSGEYSDEWRLSSVHAPWPPREQIYIVEEVTGEKTFHGWDFLIRYNPKDEVMGCDSYGYPEWHERKNRVSFKLYSDEVLNFDEITFADCDYFVKNRLERLGYLEMLPMLHWIRKLKEKEEKLENEFVRLILGNLSWEDTEDNKGKIKEAIKWWKLKNKWKRDLMVDDAKAVRMIERRLKR